MNNSFINTAVLPIILFMLTVSGNAVAGKSQTDCVKLAMQNGYGGPTCASSFIQTCMDTSSRSELESVFQFDMGSFGYGRSKKCGPPGEPGRDKFANEWNKIASEKDTW